jgi:hypothetical protein
MYTIKNRLVAVSQNSFLIGFVPILLLVVYAAVLHSAAAADLVSDGGFESATAGAYTGAIGDGWIATQGEIGILNNSFGDGTAHSGQQFADLDALFANNELSQTLSTVPGQVYRVSFWLSDDTGGNPLQVNFGATPLFDGTTPDLGSGNYALLTFNVVATSSTSNLSFTSKFANGGVGAVIDDVSVTATSVPEPTTWAMMLIGFGALAWFSTRISLAPRRHDVGGRSTGIHDPNTALARIIGQSG